LRLSFFLKAYFFLQEPKIFFFLQKRFFHAMPL
jgi:hypothetical protein